MERKPGPAIVPPPSPSPPKPSTPEEYQRLRRILIGAEVDEIEMIRARLDEPEIRGEETGKVLARAVDASVKGSAELRRSMQPVVEEGLRTFGRRDPEGFSDILFPVVGPAIRKAVAAAMQSLVDGLSRTLEQSLSVKSLQWRLEALRSGKSYGEIVLLRSMLFRVEQVFLIHRDTGILLEHRASDPATARDASLVSSMLSAIRDFVRDSFKTGAKEELETVQYGETSVWIQSGPRALIACAVRGSAPASLRGVMQENLERIHFSHYEALEHFRGDVSKFAGTRPHLEACMLGRAPEQYKGATLRWKPWAAIALLALGGFLYWNQRDQQRWNVYLQKLRQEPGLRLTAESRGWGQYRVEGLRDPLAADPVALLAQTDLESTRVQQAWSAYLSMEPSFVARRRVEALAEIVSKRFVRFDSAKFELSDADLDQLDQLADDIRLLLKTASEAQIQAKVDLSGHADSQGDPKSNVELSRKRAEWTKAALVKQGIPEAALRAVAGPADALLRRRVIARAVVGS